MVQLRDLGHNVHTLKYSLHKHHSFIWMNLFGGKSRGICQTRILESKMATLLQGLNLSSKPRVNYCCSSYSIIPQSSNPLQQFYFSNLDIPMVKPLGALLGRSRNSFRKSRRMIINVKPLSTTTKNIYQGGQKALTEAVFANSPELLSWLIQH